MNNRQKMIVKPRESVDKKLLVLQKFQKAQARTPNSLMPPSPRSNNRKKKFRV